MNITLSIILRSESELMTKCSQVLLNGQGKTIWCDHNRQASTTTPLYYVTNNFKHQNNQQLSAVTCASKNNYFYSIFCCMPNYQQTITGVKITPHSTIYSMTNETFKVILPV